MECHRSSGQEINNPSTELRCKMKMSLLILFICISALFLNGCDFNDYNTAVSYLEKGDYESAVRMFTELNDYKDSREKLQESTYLLAIERMKDGKYSLALANFKNVDMDFKETSTLRQKCEYELLLQYFSADRAVHFRHEPALSDMVKMVNEVSKNSELAPLLAERIYHYAVELLSQNKYALSILYFELTPRHITPDQDVLYKLYHYGLPLLTSFLTDASDLFDHKRLGKQFFLNKKYHNLDRIFFYLATAGFLDSADWNHRLKQSSILPFVQFEKYAPYSGKVSVTPYVCMVIADDAQPAGLMVSLKAALTGKIFFTDDAGQAGLVIELHNQYQLNHAAVQYVGGTSVDYYDTKSTIYVRNSAGDELYSRSCLSRYGTPEPLVNPGERSRQATTMSGDECAVVKGDIARIFDDYYGKK